jgi:hypothetical protein
VQRNVIEVAWAAGLFEGEGCIVYRGRTAAELILGTTDEDIAQRFAAVMGYGSVSTEERTGTHKTLYRWYLSEGTKIAEVLTLLMPHFGARRRQRAADTLARLRDNRGRNGTKTHCPRGHEYTPENTAHSTSGSRTCIACRRERQRETARLKREAATTPGGSP